MFNKYLSNVPVNPIIDSVVLVFQRAKKCQHLLSSHQNQERVIGEGLDKMLPNFCMKCTYAFIFSISESPLQVLSSREGCKMETGKLQTLWRTDEIFSNRLTGDCLQIEDEKAHTSEEWKQIGQGTIQTEEILVK